MAFPTLVPVNGMDVTARDRNVQVGAEEVMGGWRRAG